MATIRPNLEHLRALGQMTQMFRWTVEFEKLPSALNPWLGDAINFRAESVGIPKLNPNSTEVVIRGHKAKYPGIADYENTITLTCFETIDNNISNFLRTWREMCWQSENGSTGITQNKEDLEATMLIMRLNNKDAPIWMYKLFGCYLETADSGGDLDASTADPMKPALTLSFDYFNDKSLL
jgi:hypothetical protein